MKLPLMSVNMTKQSAQSENLSLKPEVDTLLVEIGVEPISYRMSGTTTSSSRRGIAPDTQSGYFRACD
jgi:hypothetical protein